MKAPHEVADYYREYHNKLISWYITIQSFVFAGLLAAARSPGTMKTVGGLCFVFIIAVFILFVLQIGTFSDRIRLLESYGEAPPADWMKAHKKRARCWPKGEGSLFFLLLLVSFATANLGLLWLKDFVW